MLKRRSHISHERESGEGKLDWEDAEYSNMKRSAISMGMRKLRMSQDLGAR